MNSTHVAAAGITSMLADLLMYLSHWPLQALTADTATSIAGLLVAVAGGGIKLYQHKFLNGNGNGNGNGVAPPAPAPAPAPAPLHINP